MPNPVIDDILATGTTPVEGNERLPVHSGVGPETGTLLRSAIASVRPQTAIEVGLAFGLSTLHILDALSQNGDGRLIGMDPAQHDSTWRGGGLLNVKRAGFDSRYQFLEESSQVALPRLAAAGTRVQFAFVDGWHTFDHALVDFFFIDLMMDVGGIVAFDDVAYPGLRRLAQFIVANRSYAVADVVEAKSAGWRSRAKIGIQKALYPLVRDDLTPSVEVRQKQAGLLSAAVVALRKLANDSRRFDHFVAF